MDVYVKRREFLRSSVTVAATLSLPTALAAIDERPLAASSVSDFAEAAAGIERLRAAVVVDHGQRVLDRAFRGANTDTPVNVKSVSKSLVSTLVGVAQHRGYIESVSQTLGELAPELIPDESDARVADLSLENLLTMQAGLERVSGRAYGRWVNSDNWVRYALTRPFVAEPGAGMLYSTGDTHVLGAVLTRLTGQSLHELAKAWLGQPLNIRFPAWTRDPQGFFLGGNEMALSPRDLARVGELYLADGVVAGQRLLPKGWVQAAFTPRTRSVFSGDGYGYSWFLRQHNDLTAAYARGFGGQVLYVVPERALVVAITSDPSLRARSNGYMGVLHDLIGRHLLPA